MDPKTRNQIPTQFTEGKSPQELWTGAKPDLSRLRVFGSICYAHITDDTRSKLDANSVKCRMLGYAEDSKAYRLQVIGNGGRLNTGQIIHRRDVIFNEQSIFNLLDTEANPSAWIEIEAEESEGVIAPPPAAPAQAVQPPQPIMPPIDPFAGAQNQPAAPDASDSDDDDGASDSGSAWQPYAPTTPMVAPMNRPTRGWKPSEKALQRFNFLTIKDTDRQAEESDEWKAARDSEMEAHRRNQTWITVDRPKDQKVIGSRWVHTLKRDKEGAIERYKARFVACGYSQAPGIDYGEVYAPVAGVTSLRVILALAAHLGLFLCQIDVKTAFFNSPISE